MALGLPATAVSLHLQPEECGTQVQPSSKERLEVNSIYTKEILFVFCVLKLARYISSYQLLKVCFEKHLSCSKHMSDIALEKLLKPRAISLCC